MEIPFVASLAAMYTNGRVVQVVSPARAPDLTNFINLGALHSTYFFERFWKAGSVCAALPYTLCDLNLLDASVLRRALPVELPSILATALLRGGAYTTVPMRARKAIEIADHAAEVLLGGDLDSPHVYVPHAQWSTFFYDVAWHSA